MRNQLKHMRSKQIPSAPGGLPLPGSFDPGSGNGDAHAVPWPDPKRKVKVYGDTDTSYSTSVILPGNKPKFNFMGEGYETELEMAMAMLRYQEGVKWAQNLPTGIGKPRTAAQIGAGIRKSKTLIPEFGIASRFNVGEGI